MKLYDFWTGYFSLYYPLFNVAQVFYFARCGWNCAEPGVVNSVVSGCVCVSHHLPRPDYQYIVKTVAMAAGKMLSNERAG